MKIIDVLKKESIFSNLNSQNKPDLLRELSELLTSYYPNIDTDTLFDVLLQREKLCSTAVDSGVAIPHCKMSGLSDIIAAFGRSKDGIDFESLDGNPTHLFILLLAPENAAGSHLKLLARISNIFKSHQFRKKLIDAQNRDEIYDLIKGEDEKD